MSAVRHASVLGSPRSWARRSAIASSRRIRPAIASLVSGGSASWPSSSSDACRFATRSRPADHQVIGRVGAEDLQGALHPGAGGDRGAGRPAQVRVVEVRQAVGGGADLAAHPPFLPGQHAVVRPEPGQHRRDRLAVADHHPVHAAHLTGLGGDLQPPRGPHQGQRRLRTGAGDLQGASTGPARSATRAPGRRRARRPRSRRCRPTPPAAAARVPGARSCPAVPPAAPAPRRP